MVANRANSREGAEGTDDDRNRNRKFEISTEPTKAKSRETAYSQALIQNKIDRQWVTSGESGRQIVRQLS